MTILWLTTALSVIALLSVAVVLGTLAVGLAAYLLSCAMDLLLRSEAPVRHATRSRHAEHSMRRRSREQTSWMLSA